MVVRPLMAWPRTSAAAFFALMILSVQAVAPAQSQTTAPSQKPERQGPVTAASVVWVGHSLIEAKVETPRGTVDLISMVGNFARHKGLAYNQLGHTLWGSPLSALWRGAPHSYPRDAQAMVERRKSLANKAQDFDTMVLTEVVPLTAKLMQLEFSSYYLRRFYCTLKQANPAARVYLYETWAHLQANGPKADAAELNGFDWFAQMKAQRSIWRRLVDEAQRPSVAQPGWLSRLGLSWHTDAGCTATDPIYVVPVGDAFVAIARRLQKPQPGDAFALPSGDMLAVTDFFANPYLNWPTPWPASDGNPAAVLAQLKLRDSAKPHDDIHLSSVGIYVAALVHFATLYRTSPVGLPMPPEIGDQVGQTLQRIIWKTVRDEPRSGVSGKAIDNN